MPPQIKCPNCGLDEWLENPELSYVPTVRKEDNDNYVADTENGMHVRIWRCNNCMYIMQFWEPD